MGCHLESTHWGSLSSAMTRHYTSGLCSTHLHPLILQVGRHLLAVRSLDTQDHNLRWMLGLEAALTSALEPARYWSFRLLITASTVKVFSLEKTYTVEPCCLRYDLDLSSLIAFMDSVRRCQAQIIMYGHFDG